MGHWGVRSYDNDDADDAIDAGFEAACGAEYEDLMDDRNPLSFDQVQKKLASPRTLEEAIRALEGMIGGPLEAEPDRWDPEARLALAGVVVRHAEFGVSIPQALRERAIAFLEAEDIDWDEETKRRLRREKEIALLRRQAERPA
ncbi:hypothetical protein [Aquisphaera insulae]|uniref:hypothetical protein n=1 Tax=Aquisphaera insulae TaxID=2712864 RepID=UPI0013EBBA38|nr:hypothetical protein [Aquisphaera insulae]